MLWLMNLGFAAGGQATTTSAGGYYGRVRKKYIVDGKWKSVLPHEEADFINEYIAQIEQEKEEKNLEVRQEKKKLRAVETKAVKKTPEYRREDIQVIRANISELLSQIETLDAMRREAIRVKQEMEDEEDAITLLMLGI